MSPGAGAGLPVMTAPDLEPAARRVVALLDGVPDSALAAPTRPATISPASTGPSSRTTDNTTMPAMALSAPKREKPV